MALIHSKVLELPFEIRAKIWQYARPIVVTVNCCSYNTTTEATACQQSHSTRKDARRCIRLFLKILNHLDPLQVARYDSKLIVPGHRFFFCSASCLCLAMRLATPIQRAYFDGARVRINFTLGDLVWIHSSPDSQVAPANLDIEHAMKPSSRDFEILGDQDDVEGRIWRVQQELGRRLRGVLGEERKMVGCWREIGEGDGLGGGGGVRLW